MNTTNTSMNSVEPNKSAENLESKKKKKKQTFKNFFMKLKIDKKSKKENQKSSSEEDILELNNIFDVAKKIISIFNKIQIIDFFFKRICETQIVLNTEVNESLKLEIKSFCSELEEHFYGVMEKLVMFYSNKISEADVESKNVPYVMPSMETCGLLNILGMNFYLSIIFRLEIFIINILRGEQLFNIV